MNNSGHIIRCDSRRGKFSTYTNKIEFKIRVSKDDRYSTYRYAHDVFDKGLSDLLYQIFDDNIQIFSKECVFNGPQYTAVVSAKKN